MPRYSEYPNTLAPFQQVPEPAMPNNVSFPHHFPSNNQQNQQQSPGGSSMGPGSPFGVPGKYLATVVYQGLGNNLLPHHERMRTQTSYAYHMFIDIYNEIITHPILICNFVAKLHFSKHSSPAYFWHKNF